MTIERVMIRSKTGQPLNRIVDQLFRKLPDPSIGLETFQIITGKGSMLGMGDEPQVQIICSYRTTDEARPEAIDLLLALAEEAGMDIEVRLTTEPATGDESD